MKQKNKSNSDLQNLFDRINKILEVYVKKQSKNIAKAGKVAPKKNPVKQKKVTK